MRILAFFALLLGIVFYISRIIKMLSGRSRNPANRQPNQSVESRINQAKPANVIDVKTVTSSAPNKG